MAQQILTRAQMIAIINNGGVIVYQGRIIREIAQIPTQDQVDDAYPIYLAKEFNGNAVAIKGRYIVTNPPFNDGDTLSYNETNDNWEITSGSGGVANLSSLVTNQTMFDGSQASRSLTFGLSGSADPSFTFSDSQIDVSSGILSVGGTAVSLFGHGHSASDINSGILAIARGGTGDSTYSNGQLLIGNSTGSTLTKATLTGTSGSVVVTNGTGSITLNTGANVPLIDGANIFSINQSVRILNATTSTVSTALFLIHSSSATPAAGFGTSIEFDLQDDTTDFQSAVSLSALWTTATHASHTANLVINCANVGGGLTEVARFFGNGDFQITGNSNNGGIMSVIGSTSNTTTVQTTMSLRSESTGTPAANFGTGIDFRLKSSTTANQLVAQISANWLVATHSGRDPYLAQSLSVTNTSVLVEKTRLTNTAFAPSTTGDLTLGTSSLGWKHFYLDQTITAGGTTGNRTINKSSGTVNIAAGGSSVTVTNSEVTTSSTIFVTIRINDSTATIKNVVPSSGSFVITLTAAATAEVSIGFIVVN